MVEWIKRSDIAIMVADGTLNLKPAQVRLTCKIMDEESGKRCAQTVEKMAAMLNHTHICYRSAQEQNGETIVWYDLYKRSAHNQ